MQTNGENLLRTGDILEDYCTFGIKPDRLAAWALTLLDEGFESDAIYEVAGNPRITWQEAEPYFIKICRDIELSRDVSQERKTLRTSVWLSEYTKGIRSACSICQRDEVRRAIGYPDVVTLEIYVDAVSYTHLTLPTIYSV